MTPQPAPGLYGVFTVGDAQVALPLSELREVIPCPSRVDTLLTTAVGLVGAVNLRHQVIPVVDLRRVLAMDATEPMDVVVIVAHEGQVFGLLASDVRGVVGISDGELFEYTMGGTGRPLFTSSFERPEDGAVVCVLDSAAVRDLPGMPVVRDTGGGHIAPDPTDATTGGTRTVMLMRCEPFGLCIEVTHVHSVIPDLLVKSSPLDGPAVRGVVRIGDEEVPVIDPLAFLGLGSLPMDGADRGVALCFDRGLLVLAVSDVVSIVPAPAKAVLPLPDAGLPASSFLSGILAEGGDGPYLVLDGDAVRADDELERLAALGMSVVEGDRSGQDTFTTGPDVDADDPHAAVPSVRTFLTYSAGVEIATPLAQISEILPFPTDLIPMTWGGGTVHGVFIHRGSAIPLVHLSALLGREEALDAANARVLLVEAERGHVGFAVPQLRAIEESVWEQPVNGSPRSDELLGSSPLVEVGDGEQTRMLPNVDLRVAAGAV